MVERTSLEFFEEMAAGAEGSTISDLIYLSRLREWQTKLSEAEELLDRAEVQDDAFWEVKFIRATYRVRSDDLRGALSIAKVASELAPWKRQIWLLLSEIYRGLAAEENALMAEERVDEIDSVREALRQDDS